jgi:hypothetical protein
MASSVDNIEKLYKNYDILNDATEKSEVRIFSHLHHINRQFDSRGFESLLLDKFS